MAVDLDSAGALDRVRDYIGDTPDDGTLYTMAESATYWQEVALRVLRRRLANASSGESTTSFSLSGVMSVGMKAADISTLTGAIVDLEQQIAALTGGAAPGAVTVARIVRPDRR